MGNSLHVVSVVIDVFMYAGAVCFGFLFIAFLVIVAKQKTWVPVHAMLEREGKNTLARWFDDGAASVGSAILTRAQATQLAHTDAAELWVQPGKNGTVRLHPEVPERRPVFLAMVDCGALFLVSFVIMMVMTALR